MFATHPSVTGGLPRSTRTEGEREDLGGPDGFTQSKRPLFTNSTEKGRNDSGDLCNELTKENPDLPKHQWFSRRVDRIGGTPTHTPHVHMYSPTHHTDLL